MLLGVVTSSETRSTTSEEEFQSFSELSKELYLGAWPAKFLVLYIVSEIFLG